MKVISLNSFVRLDIACFQACSSHYEQDEDYVYWYSSTSVQYKLSVMVGKGLNADHANHATRSLSSSRTHLCA